MLQFFFVVLPLQSFLGTYKNACPKKGEEMRENRNKMGEK